MSHVLRCFVLVACSTTYVACSAPAASPAPVHAASELDPPRELSGSWLHAQSRTHYEFARGQMRQLSGEDALSCTRAKYSSERIALDTPGMPQTWMWKVVDGRLKLDATMMRVMPDEHGQPRPVETRMSWELEAVKERPAGFDPTPFALPAQPVLTPERLAALQKELAERKEQDQAVRKSPMPDELMYEVDEGNTRWLIATLQEAGWIDSERFGKDAALAAFLIVQHSQSLRLMLTALPLLERDVMAKKLDAQHYALLYDRVQLRRGGKQRYGSQIGIDAEGRLIVMHLESKERLDEVRAAIGLAPFAKYIELIRKNSGNASAEVVYQTDP